MNNFYPTKGRMRKLGHAWVADNAVLVGKVHLAADVNLWFHCVLRGDDAAIHVGARTNIQDLSMVHPEPNDDMWIGEEVTVGHRAMLHGKKIGDRCLIGMGAILLGWSEIGEECIIAAGALVREHSKIPPRSLVVGVPGKVIRSVTPEEIASMRPSAEGYVRKVAQYLE